MGTSYIIVNHSTKEFISTKLLQGYDLKKGEWEINDDALMLMGLALGRWADSMTGSGIDWIGLDDDRGWKLRQKYRDITRELVAGFNSEFVIRNHRSKRLHFPALWLHKLWRLKDGIAPFDFSEKVVVDKPKLQGGDVK